MSPPPPSPPRAPHPPRLTRIVPGCLDWTCGFTGSIGRLCNSVYSDPEADCEEESREVVAEFFEDTNSAEQQRLRQLRTLFKKRNRGGPRQNNW